ncbi:MAG: HAD family hydrolase [Deltaproteobacteria bacterium]|nr:HAD family hydrolase [Deltaproteobacteria bacterium]
MYRAVVFDLYDTLVVFRPQVPALEVAGTRYRSTMEWMAETVARELPAVEFGDFLRAVAETTTEIIRARPPEYLEVPSAERFRRVLLRLDYGRADLAEKAACLSQVHMCHLAAQTELPAEHLALVQALAARYPLGLVSNFDHGPTARAILARHRLTDLFRSIVISDGFGRRKPHPAIFAEALRQLGAAAAEALFIGDSAVDDVAGASAAGMATLWINARREPLPDGVPAPTHTVTRLVAVAEILGIELQALN